MKSINKAKYLLLALTAFLCVFFTVGIRGAKAESSAFGAGNQVSITNVSGNLGNTNLRIEFTTNVNLDGTNNALLVALASEDGTVLTDTKFIYQATTSGVYDEDDIAIVFQNAPKAIGTKSENSGVYTYAFESRDFKVVNDSKAIAKLVIVGQKGATISSTLSCSEVKYSVKFGSANATEYSYNAEIVAPGVDIEYLYDIDGHKAVTGWIGDDSIAYAEGAKAVKNIVYTYNTSAQAAHSWTDVAEVPATIVSSGTKAHQVCACGAKRLNAESTELVADQDLVISPLNHTCTFEASFDWTNATNAGDKPVVTYTCTEPLCGKTHVMDAIDVTVTEKSGSKVNPTCTAKGSVIYTASCTYSGVPASDEKTYDLPIKSHTLTHHAAVAQSLENDGNIEYWTCSECNGYFLDEAGTNATSSEAVVLPKYTLEEAQVISVNDLYQNGKKQSNILYLSNELYSYNFEKANKSTSLQFKWYVNSTTNGDRVRFHNYVSASDKWNGDCAAWFVLDQSKILINQKNSEKNDYVTTNGINISKGLHAIEFTCQAIMNGSVATGEYMVTVKFDGELVRSLICEYDAASLASNLFINSSKTMNLLYDISFDGDVLEEAQTVNVYDLTALGTIKNIDSETHYTYTGSTTNYSRIFKFNLTLSSLTQDSSLIVDLGTGNSCRLWMQGGNNKNFFFAWNIDGHKTDRFYLDGTGSVGIVPGETYEVEMGRIRIVGGINAGKDLVYIKVNGEYLVNQVNPYYPSWLYVNPEAENGYPITKNAIGIKAVDYALFDVAYVEPTFESADIISVNDLRYEGQYQNGAINLLESKTYHYSGSSTYGSVIFKGIFNFNKDNFSNGDTSGTQIRFTNQNWSNEGMVWFHATEGTLIPNPNGGYYKGTKLSTGVDVEVEIGRLAIMDGDTFTGKHYFYVKLDGVIVNEYISQSVEKDIYESKAMFFTGKEGNGSNTIKNVSINKTVTIKVGEHTETITVLRSGLVTIPTFASGIVPSDKRIVGWVIDGTDTAFDPQSDHVFGDITISAVLDDFMWKITFGGEDSYVKNGVVITAPETDPTKAYDSNYHYEFECWVDAEGNAFVSGTTASKDIAYTAKFKSLDHTYGEWTTTSEPTCTVDGSKKRECSCGYTDMGSIPAAHKLEGVEAVAETCTEDGNIAYYECSVCHKKYSDNEAANEIENVVVAAHHTVFHIDAVSETCTEDGNIECYECSVCHKLFTDETATEEATNVIIPMHHTLTKVEAVEATCTKRGNIEYYQCTICQKKFAEETAITEIFDIYIPMHHTLTKVNAVEATCTEDGNIEYNHCSECGKNFDETGRQVNDIVIPALGHAYDDKGICTVCEEKDPDYKPQDRPMWEDWGVSINNLIANIKSGCKSSVSASSLIVLLAISGIIIKRKREDEE